MKTPPIATFFSLAAIFSAAAVCALLVAAPIQAAPINYGDFDDFVGGGVVEYQDVTESSVTDPVPLFGVPEVTVNELDFDPAAFGSSSGGSTVDLTDGQLNFDFELLAGAGLTSLIIDEGGDFTLFGAGTAATSVAYGLYAAVTVTEVDGVSITPFTVSGSTSVTEDLVTSPGLNQPWSLGLFLDLGAALVGNGYSGFTEGVTAGEFVLNNTLVATSEVGTLAFIAKKDLSIIPGGDLVPDDVIPEPTTLALVLIGAAASLRARRNG